MCSCTTLQSAERTANCISSSSNCTKTCRISQLTFHAFMDENCHVFKWSPDGSIRNNRELETPRSSCNNPKGSNSISDFS